MAKAKIFLSLKNGILDPQGKAVQGAMHSLGFKEISNVRVGKYITLELKAKNKAEAEKEAKAICLKLANPVTEQFEYEVQE